jgi:hypothetical protein
MTKTQWWIIGSLSAIVRGSDKTNAYSFRGDKIERWSKMINPMKAGVIMTNYPLALKKYIDNL